MIRCEDYTERIAVLSASQKRRLERAMQDEHTLAVLKEVCDCEEPIRVEIDDYLFPMASLEDIQNLRQALGLAAEIPA